ncbi:MAG: amino acid ABC transporter substrate-binding protein [Selenomonadaceae bacterium]|nr:amino acid ABC transporter substrate-binding protein [Selenomonadaceae bacterium]
MKYRVIIMIFAVVMLLIGAGCGEQSQNNINTNSTAKGKIIIGFDENFPPFGFKDEAGNIVGFDIDLAKETMKRLGREVEFKPIDWSNKENELNSGSIDIIWNGLEIIGDRERYILFSKPYMKSGQIVFVHHSNQLSLITNKSKLAGSIIGVQADSTAETHLNLDNELRYTLKELRRYSDNAMAFNDLAERKIDAVIADEINGRYYVFRNGIDNKIDALDVPIGEMGEIAIGFRKDDTALCNEVQQAFDSMVKDGTAKRISKKWFGKDLILSK